MIRAKGKVTSADQSRTKTIRGAVRDLDFICRQILRFARIPPKQLIKHMAKRRDDALCMIPHPDGRGHLICGIEATRRFDTLTERVLEYEPWLAGRLSRGKTKDTR